MSSPNACRTTGSPSRFMPRTSPVSRSVDRIPAPPKAEWPIALRSWPCIGRMHVGQKDLVERGPAGHLPQRPYRNSRSVHADQERGQVTVPRLVGGPADDLADVGEVRAGRPDFLA